MAHQKKAPADRNGGAEKSDNKTTCKKKDSTNEGSEQASETEKEQSDSGPEILDNAPAAIYRPLCIVDGHAYAVAWIWLKGPGGKPKTKRAVIRDDGVIFGDVPILGARSRSDLEMEVHPAAIREDCAWSSVGVRQFLAKKNPDPANVFHRVTAIVDRFVHFNKSLADQNTMCELIGCQVIGTYLLDAFNVVGYVWATGDSGSGKTQR